MAPELQQETPPIRWYCVGGAVRDQHLGRPVHDRDFVVVGACEATLEAHGFRPVGKDFPVFLHPESHEECALARTERKAGHGYRGFTIHAAADVTLEADLARRDLTINALAQPVANDPLHATPEVDWDAASIDPFGGLEDLRNGCLRHVSDAFCEDPVRLLRIARFAAQLDAPPDSSGDAAAPAAFKVHPDTAIVLRDMVASGEIEHLQPERVWTELEKTLRAHRPLRFFEVLQETGALAVLFPDIARLFGVPQPPRYHPEIDTGVHTFLVLDEATRRSSDPIVRFAALVHDLGKGTTPATILPSHHGHEQRGVKLIRALCERLRIPNEYRDLAIMVAAEHGRLHRLFDLRAATIVDLIERLDLQRRPERLETFLAAVESDYRGRTGFQQRAYPQADAFREAVSTAGAIRPDAELLARHRGAAIGDALRRKRIAAIAQLTWVQREIG